MDIVKAIKSNNFAIDIVIQDTNQEPLFRANDIGVILEISNIRSNIQDFDNTEKATCVTDTPGGPQNMLYLTVKGLKRVISKSRKTKAIDLANKLGLDIHDNMYVPFETSFIDFLQKVYGSEKFIHQYKIEPYIIDLYFPEHHIAVECDEHHHNFNKEDDEKREKYIKEKLNCVFIRFKQSKKNENLPELIGQINKEIEKNKLYNLRAEIMRLNTKLDIYEKYKVYNWDYVEEFGLRDAGYETPVNSDSD
jgi:very-short-patch-repair endonuclease